MSAATSSMPFSLQAGKLPKGTPWMLLVGSWVVFAAVFLILQAAGMMNDFSLWSSPSTGWTSCQMHDEAADSYGAHAVSLHYAWLSKPSSALARLPRSLRSERLV